MTGRRSRVRRRPAHGGKGDTLLLELWSREPDAERTPPLPVVRGDDSAARIDTTVDGEETPYDLPKGT